MKLEPPRRNWSLLKMEAMRNCTLSIGSKKFILRLSVSVQYFVFPRICALDFFWPVINYSSQLKCVREKCASQMCLGWFMSVKSMLFYELRSSSFFGHVASIINFYLGLKRYGMVLWPSVTWEIYPDGFARSVLEEFVLIVKKTFEWGLWFPFLKLCDEKQ